MKKFILPSILIISLLGVGVYYYRYMQGDLEQNHREKPFYPSLEKISHIWQKGEFDHALAKECHGEKSYYQRCDPSFLKCLADKKVTIDGHSLEFPKLENKTLPYQIIDGRFLWIRLVNKDEKRELLLEKNCHLIKIPEGEYALGPQIRDDFIWSAEGRTIYIDKYQVLNRDVLEWMQQTSSTEYEKKKDLDPLKIADWLLPEQMQQYCAYRGGEVAMAHILDAAFFYKTYDRGDKVLHRSPYPWLARGRKTFLDDLGNKDFKLTKEHCMKIPASECQSMLNDDDLYRSSPTLSGAFQALGGKMEYSRNPIRPRRNLNASSFYFPMKSYWHQVGRRAYWDGRGHHATNFIFSREDPVGDINHFTVAFRCMREEK